MAFEFVHVAPETPTTLDRMALTAERSGFGSLVVRNHSDAGLPEFDTHADVDVYSGVEIRARDVDQLHGLMGKHHDLDFICVHGGDDGIERAAVSSDRVDVLCHPSHFDHVAAREAAENGVAVEFNLAPVLRSSGGERVSALRDIGTRLKLTRKHGTPFVVSADPFDHLELRARREIRAICELVGFDDDEVEAGMEETPSKILETDTGVEVIDG